MVLGLLAPKMVVKISDFMECIEGIIILKFLIKFLVTIQCFELDFTSPPEKIAGKSFVIISYLKVPDYKFLIIALCGR